MEMFSQKYSKIVQRVGIISGITVDTEINLHDVKRFLTKKNFPNLFVNIQHIAGHVKNRDLIYKLEKHFCISYHLVRNIIFCFAQLAGTVEYTDCISAEG